MNSILSRYIIFLTFLLTPFLSHAQFYVTGDDPGRLKWYSIDTDNFSIIYPEGADSLAKVYGYKLERFRIPVSRTTGYTGGGPGRLRMPVVMHTYNTSNGSVAWAPKRMDLFTIPSAYSPEPLPWSTMLSVHEGRHVTQMQFGMTQAQKPFGWAFGEMWNILASILYPGLSTIEGDAVIAETALTPSGRGRTADFLNYYKVAFDNGDFRKWDKWRLSSQRRYAPDHYALGYLTIGGFRYLYDCPMYMKDAYDLSARRPYNLFSFSTITKQATGKKFEDAFQEVCHTMHEIWKREADARGPFIPMEEVSKEPRLYADYKGLSIMNNSLYAIKSGHETSPVLVRIDKHGNESVISRFAHQTSSLKALRRLNRLYWSEGLPDQRWTMEADSKIRYISLFKGGKKSLKGNNMLLFNPDMNQETYYAAAVSYSTDGGSSVVVADGMTGKPTSSVKAPEGVQLVETAWIGNDIYASGITEEGFGIYRLSDGDWSVGLEPQPVKIKNLKSWNGELMFTCDRTGVNELYHFLPATGELRQKTVTRYGASDFEYDEKGEYLYFSSQTMKGMKIFRTPTGSLEDIPVAFSDTYLWPIAEKLTQQEHLAALAQGASDRVPEIEVKFSEPRRYRKAAHMFNVHSWAPVYVNVDNIMNMSFDYIWQAASLGATGIMQNRLANSVGEFGYSAHKDPFEPSKWRHSGHARLTWSGWYPVIEASVDFNDRAARQYVTKYYLNGNSYSIGLNSTALDTPYLEGKISAYVPLDFSSGGWFKGVIPQLSYTISNDRFNTSAVVLDYQEGVIPDLGEDGGFKSNGWYEFSRATKGRNALRQTLRGSVRAYTMLSTPNSAVYPKCGIGIEAGASGSLESSSYLSPMGYGYVYGYVPGLISTHGIRLSMMHQTKLNDAPFGQPIVNVMPRGLSNNGELFSYLAIMNTSMTKLSADYACPVYIGDLSIGGSMFSIKRLVINPHLDYMSAGEDSLYSAGAEFILDMNSILTLEWPCSFGLTCSYNGGRSFDKLASETGINISRYYVGPTFNVTF